ncbi:ROK family transcriptional regulator [Cryptosporangium minutisporangium]|uniref:ROK family transcriptional regulator n=1 Tax=Cryptosporangium minutisporangium TaxID=113569 RepID=A0ABP6SZH9_9ACTN
MQPHESARGPHVLRQINFAAVLRAVREHSPARVADLMQATGLSRPAVTRAVAELRDAGLVADVDETAQVSMGRPAQWIRFRAEVGHVVGVDVGSHKVIAMVADLAGKVVASRQVTIGDGATGDRLLQSVRDTIAEALAKADLTGEDVWGIVVGTPGIVDESSGEVLLAPGIPGLAHLPVLDELRTLTPSPVLIENDINLAVLGERWCGAAVGSDSLVFVHWGVRIGAGIIIDGKPYRGANGAAGEIGFADVFSAPETPDPASLVGAETSGVSEHGAFERMVGTQAIAELADAAAALAARDPEALLAPDTPDVLEAVAAVTSGTASDGVAAVFAAATAGDPTALAVVDRIAARFARGLAAMLLVLDPGEVIIGGGLSRAGETLLAAIERHLRPRILTSPRLVLSDLGGDAVALGAVRRALDHVESRLLAHPGA